MNDFELLTRASGCRIYRQQTLIIIKKESGTWVNTALFVFSLLTLIPTVIGVLFLIKGLKESEIYNASIVLLGIAGLFGLVIYLLLKLRKKTKSIDPSSLIGICTFDLGNSVLLNPDNKVLDELKNVSIERKFQMTSSSKKLVVTYTKGSITLAEGNPFSGGIAPLERAFRSIGLMN